jgi:hypothetical protein
MHTASSPFEIAAMQGTELPLHSRLFVVCGRSVEVRMSGAGLPRACCGRGWAQMAERLAFCCTRPP